MHNVAHDDNSTAPFRRWLAARYPSVAALNGVWRQQFASFDDASVPELTLAAARDALPAHLDRLAYEDATAPDPAETVLDYVGDAVTDDDRSPAAALYWRIRTAARELRAAGYPTTEYVLAAVAADIDRHPEAIGAFALRAALMHGATPPAPGDPESSDAHGVRPLLERLSGGPWTADRKALVLWPRLYAHVKRIATVMARDHGPAAATAMFGFERPLQTEGPLLLKRTLDQAARARLAVAVADTRLPDDVLAGFPLVVCPTLEVLAADDMRKFLRYVQRGGFLAIGPRVPLLNEQMRSDDTLAAHFLDGLSEFSLDLMPCGDGGFFTLPGVISLETVQALMFESGLAKGFAASSPFVDLAVHRSPTGRRLLFAANTTTSSVATTLAGEPFRTLTEVGGSRMWHDASQGPLTLPPCSVTAFDVA
ncbi:MAG TPA: hypothetical protein PLP01_10090 [Phycisphaerae bacterium]|nr:hypothetical protein [Phycisphaerae bacterium]HOI55587.1 hypothetical protein [Phycisphaerae bacterium]